jgi:putative oxidoreductase
MKAFFQTIVSMLGAITTAQLQNGFYLNWFGKQQGEGYEYHLLVIGMSLALLVTGAGKWSVDKVIAERIRA